MNFLIVGDYPSAEEQPRAGGPTILPPFSGASGHEFAKMLHEAAIPRSDCFLTYVSHTRPYGSNASLLMPEKKKDIRPEHVLWNGRHIVPELAENISRLVKEIELVQPNVIIAVGPIALFVLTGNRGLRSWRSSVLPCTLDLKLDYNPIKVIPTYHPSTIMSQWSERPTVIHDLKRAQRESLFREWTPERMTFTIRPTYDQVLSILSGLTGELAVDIETRHGHIDCIGIAWTSSDAICIPLMVDKGQSSYWTLEQEAEIVWQLKCLFERPDVIVIGQNFSYDIQYIDRHWFTTPRLRWDTMLAHHTMFSSSRKSLDFLASLYCEHYTYWKDEIFDADDKIPEERRWEYNCKDCCYTFEIAKEEARSVEKLSATWPKLPQIVQFQQDLFWPVYRSMRKGLNTNKKRKQELAATLLAEIQSRQNWLIDILGHDINIKSPVQMQQLFYNDLKQRPVINRKTGRQSCDDAALSKIAEREPLLRPIINKIQELRSLGVFLSTFVNAPLDLDGRMRCSFNIGGTETYRFSSSANAFNSGMNLQNIPKGGDDGGGLELPNIRELFLPDPGYTFFDIDLDSADLRIVVAESHEEEMAAMLASGLKVYVEVAKEYYHDPTITKHHHAYRLFKSFCHATHYLGSPRGIASRLGLTVHEVDRLQQWYFGRFPRIKAWQDDFKAQVSSRRYIENIFGYRCYTFDRISDSTFREMIAWLPQSTVACLINRGYVNIHENLPEVSVLLQVHDSLGGQFKTMYGDWAVRRIVEECSIELPYDVPITIPVGIKTSTESWGGCE